MDRKLDGNSREYGRSIENTVVRCWWHCDGDYTMYGGMEVAFLIVSRRSMYSVHYHDFAHTLIIMGVDVCELCLY